MNQGLPKKHRFLAPEHFERGDGEYFLLPFRFKALNSKEELLVSEVGDYLIAEKGLARKIVSQELSPTDPIFPDLVSRFFISPEPIPDLIDVLATRYRTKKSFLDSFTYLHIFVVTLRCNHNCRYCQVISKNEHLTEYDMSFEDLDRAIELMFSSPAKHLTVEFQGGEPFLAVDRVKYAVNNISKRNIYQKRVITYVLCTNLTVLSSEHLAFCKEHDILISTSLDGPDWLHNANRLCPGLNSYAVLKKNIKKCRDVLGFDKVSALFTTSALALQYPREIVDEYRAQGFSSLFLRAINPYGLARMNPKQNMYDSDEFIEFYKKALAYIIELNMEGIYFVEQYAKIILSKILTPFPVGFVDLQSPAGVINSVIVYNYDGYVYPSDEARMLASEVDFSFRLGSLKESSYRDIFYGDRAQQIAQYWATEALPGCSECAFQPYCGADPVRNYATQGDMAGFRPESSFCQKNREIIRFLFELMSQNLEIERIFRSWVNNNPGL
jgi:His-Xaa-Ser system radical SAM maturase HxsB